MPESLCTIKLRTGGTWRWTESVSLNVACHCDGTEPAVKVELVLEHGVTVTSDGDKKGHGVYRDVLRQPERREEEQV